MSADAPCDARVFVDVVAQVSDEVEFLPRHVLVGSKQPLLVVLTRGEGELERCEGPGSRCRAQAADRAGRVSHDEPVDVPAIGREPIHVDVQAVGELRCGRRPPLPYDAPEPVVLGHLPPHDRSCSVHPALGLQWTGRQTRPEDTPCRCRIARRDTELEGVVDQPRARGDTPATGYDGGKRGQTCQIAEKVAAVHCRLPG